ncbi:diguanylate cyclase [Maritimibacter dapengensis]|uniref:diguanylate cyclase n=1 Tax=Maritimibacter dapengensis TaxID=2836868 RepID=A0ABS6T132_9RHOB|nr:diguanylate cyclase [Maritimibacter dapengensis]MBV7378092.1 diguanylate cyclase [Maritimibacter dapengensis]
MSGPILIADDLVTERIALKARLAGSHNRIVQVKTRDELLSEVALERPDAIVMDIGFDNDHGVDLCRRLKSSRDSRDIPVILYGVRNDENARIAAFEAGADDCLENLPGERLLQALLRNLMRKRSSHDELTRRRALVDVGELSEAQVGFNARMELALIAPDMATAMSWRHALAPNFAGAIRVHTRKTILNVSDDASLAPDAVIIAEDPKASKQTLQLVSELRSRPATRGSVILFQAAGAAHDMTDMALDLGADAVAPAIASAKELAIRLETLVAHKREMDRLRAFVEDQLDVALRDPLTGLFNRRYLDCYLKKLSRDAAISGSAFSIMILDLDRFKAINDGHGHVVGDHVLQAVASRVIDSIRDVDLAARIGGEEFLVVLQGADGDRAETIAQRLRRVIADHPISTPLGATPVSVTTSVGIATSSDGRDPVQDVIEAADRALYLSKSGGRNQVTHAPLAGGSRA